MSSNDNSGKPNGPEKQPKEKSFTTSPLTVSDYIGIPKPEVVQSYVRSVYAWFSGGSSTKTPTQTPTPYQSPNTSSNANVTLAAPTLASAAKTNGNLAAGVHPSQQQSMNKTDNIYGDIGSGGEGANGPSSNNTTETPFSDLSSCATPPDQTEKGKSMASPTKQSAALVSNVNANGGNGKKEEDSWAKEMKDIVSTNETILLSSKSDNDLHSNLLNNSNNNEVGGGKQKEESKKSEFLQPVAAAENDMQFSFMNQLRDLETEKNKDFLVPDHIYFDGRDKAPPVHKPNSTRLPLSSSSAAAAPSSTGSSILPSLIPKKVGEVLSNFITTKPPKTNNDAQNQKDSK